MKKKEICLVSEAQDKCQCEWCVSNRKFQQIHLEQVTKMEALKIWIKAMEEAKIL